MLEYHSQLKNKIFYGVLSAGLIYFSGIAFGAESCSDNLGSETEWKLSNRSLMMALRSNATFTLAWYKANVENYIDSKIVAVEDMIVGDVHLNNFAPKLMSIHGKDRAQTEMVVVDFDNTEYGSVLSDLFYFSTITKSATDGISVKNIAKAFLSGLRGEDISLNLASNLSKALLLSPDAVAALNRKYTAARIKISKNSKASVTLNHRALGTTTIKNSSKEARSVYKKTKSTFVTALEDLGYQILDFGYKVKEEGGSEGLHRYLVLVEKDGNHKIFQFKLLEEFEGQEPAYSRVRSAIENFWDLPPSSGSQLAVEDHEVVQTESGTFLMAVKEKRLHRYENRVGKKYFNDFRSGTLYLSWLRGQTLAQRPAGQRLAELLHKKVDFNAFILGLNLMVKDFLVSVREQHEKVGVKSKGAKGKSKTKKKNKGKNKKKNKHKK